MRTAKEVKEEMDGMVARAAQIKSLKLKKGTEEEKKTSLEVKRMKKRMRELKPIYFFLSSSVTEEAVVNMLKSTERSLKNAEDAFFNWKEGIYNRTEHGDVPKAFYEKMMEMPKMRKQIKTLNFILGKTEKL